MNQAGLVAIALAGLWIAYLVPHRLRYRQQLLEARTDDRFSHELRVLRVARPGGTGAQHRPVRGSDPVRQQLPPGPARTYLHPTATRGGAMHRPHQAADRITADAARRTAAEHARRVAHLARRRAAARRRALLTVVLVVASVAAWTGVAVVDLALVAGAAPTVAVLGTLVLGRRAVVAGARADAEWAAGAADRVALPRGRDVTGVVGRAVHPSDAATDLIARVPRTGVRERAAVAAGAAAPAARVAPAAPPASADEAPSHLDESWAPVPVPPPMYTLKPSAPRREPAPLVIDDVPAATATVVASGTAHETSPGTSGLPTGGVDLDAVLARRRAAGE